MKLGFLHIPRTGGTYLESVLQQLGPDQFINFFGTPQNQIQNKLSIVEKIAQDLKLQQAIKQNPNWKTCRLFSGHFSQNIEKYIEGNIKFFTILREPVQRVTSFIKRVTSSREFCREMLEGAWDIGDNVFWKNFENYIERGSTQFLAVHERHGFSNYMTKAISGMDLSSENLTVNSDILAIAKENLDKMIYVGIFEDYNKTVSDILNLLNLNLKFTSRNLIVSEVPETTRELLRDLNSYDIELYNYFLNR